MTERLHWACSAGMGLLFIGFMCLMNAHAQFNSCSAGFCVGRATIAAYSGPIDAAGVSAAECWGVRACSLAATGTAAVDLTRSSDAAVCTGVKTLTNGNLDVAGSSAYCNGATQTVTAYCTAVTCRASKLYTQTGGHDATQGTVYATNQPVFVVSCPTTLLPCLQPAGGQSLGTTTFTINQIWWVAAFGQRNPSAAAVQTMVGDKAAQEICGFAAAANNAVVYATNASVTVAATDTNWHSVQCIGNGTMSVVNADNSTTTGNAGTGVLDLGVTLMTDGFGSLMTGYFSEAIIWSRGGTTPTAGQQTAVCQNQRLYYLGSTSPC